MMGPAASARRYAIQTPTYFLDQADLFLKTRVPKVPATEMRITRRMTTDMSRNAVLSTVELLEAIILCLPVRNIFTIQAVSQQFRDVIASSTQIQNKLFLRSCVPKELWDLCSVLGQPTPLRHMDSSLKFLPHSDANTNKVGNPIMPAALCPIAHSASFTSDMKAIANRFRHLKNDPAYLDFMNLNTRHGSWRQMYLTDPPCKAVRITNAQAEISSNPCRVAYLDSFRISRAGGITMGDIVDAICAKKVDDLSTYSSDGTVFRPPRTKPQFSIDQWCKKYEADREYEGQLVSLDVDVMLEGMALPTMEEWAAVQHVSPMSWISR